MKRPRYLPCDENDIPDTVRFDIPLCYRGKLIEIAYGGHHKHLRHDDGDTYKRVTDRAAKRTLYYRLADDWDDCRVDSWTAPTQPGQPANTLPGRPVPRPPAAMPHTLPGRPSPRPPAERLSQRLTPRPPFTVRVTPGGTWRWSASEITLEVSR